MNDLCHGGFISVFTHVPLGHQSWRRSFQAEDQLKLLTNWREPGGTVEIIQDRELHYDADLRPSWRFELVWYERDRSAALMFKLTHGNSNPLA